MKTAAPRREHATYLTVLSSLVLLVWASSAFGAANRKPLGVSAFGGYQTYSLSDVNDAIREPSLFLPGATGQGDEIHGGAGFGLGLRVWPSSHVSVAIDVSRLLGKSSGNGTYGGGSYSGEVSVPATSVTATLGYYLRPQTRARFGVGAGTGYYTSTGEVSAEGSGGAYSADLQGSGFGFHGLALMEALLSGRLYLDLGAGYRYARTTDVVANGTRQRNADGSLTQIDWSGFMSRLGITLYLVGR